MTHNADTRFNHSFLIPSFSCGRSLRYGGDVHREGKRISVAAASKMLANTVYGYRGMGLSMAFISHDLSVIRAICDRVYVMQFGRIIEHGSCEQVFSAPKSDYTKLLLDAIPLPEPDPGWLERGSATAA